MQVLEEYAIESSISKVVGSETVDYCVDEAVQIFGGYGFHEDYPVARAYRDSRVNRIFEGTNEINRMLIIQMLMKRAMAGVLPLIPAAMKLSEEVLAGPSFEEASIGRICRGRALARAGEENFPAGRGNGGAEIPRPAGRAAGNRRGACEYRDGYLRDGIVAAARAKERRRARGESASVMADAARAFIYDAMDRIEKEARTALAATADGDTLATQLAVLRRFAKHAPLDTIAMRRRVADAVLAQDRYPFEGR